MEQSQCTFAVPKIFYLWHWGTNFEKLINCFQILLIECFEASKTPKPTKRKWPWRSIKPPINFIRPNQFFVVPFPSWIVNYFCAHPERSITTHVVYILKSPALFSSQPELCLSSDQTWIKGILIVCANRRDKQIFTFSGFNTDSNMSGLNHWNIISTITLNSKRLTRIHKSYTYPIAAIRSGLR